MILILRPGLDSDALARVLERLQARRLRARLLDEPVEGGRRLIEILETEAQRAAPDPTPQAQLAEWSEVERIVSFTGSYPRAARAIHRFRYARRLEGARRDGTAVPEGHVYDELDAEHFAWIAGPCSVEDPDSMGEIASLVARAGATMLRGGAYKPRTSPYAFQGLGRDGLLLLRQVGNDFGLPIVTEVLDPRDVDFVAQYADVLQIGARNMQNFALLRELAQSGRPLLLKRAPSATLDEWLGAAEHLLAAGAEDLALCERGVTGHDPSRRNLLDLSVIPALRARTRLPVVVDPSHATGKRGYVVPMAKAAVVAGADAVMTEVHVRPDCALSDNAQALRPEALPELSLALRVLCRLEGRRFSTGPCFRADGAEASLWLRLSQEEPGPADAWSAPEPSGDGEARPPRARSSDESRSEDPRSSSH